MATAKEREEFISLFREQFPKRNRQECIEAARLLLRHARTHGNLAVMQCNGPEHLNVMAPYDWQKQPAEHAAWIKRNHAAMADWEAAREKKELAVEKRISDICASFKLPVIFGGDPRGFTVKVKFPSGIYNTWGGREDGYGVPQ